MCICIYIYICVYMGICIWVYESMNIIDHSDTLRTWKWSPTRGAKYYPRWIWQINREIENERKPENPRFDLWLFTIYFSHFRPKSNMILWSIRTFWYKDSAENKKKYMFANKCIFLKNSSLALTVWFFKKVDIWYEKTNIG